MKIPIVILTILALLPYYIGAAGGASGGGDRSEAELE